MYTVTYAVDSLDSQQRQDNVMYTVTYAVDSLDSNPTVRQFDKYSEVEEFMHEKAQQAEYALFQVICPRLSDVLGDWYKDKDSQ